MINFLRITNKIKIGDYLHSDGNIDDRISSDIVGICVIPSDFLPDGYARFIASDETADSWSNDYLPINRISSYRDIIPGEEGTLRSGAILDLDSPFESDIILSPFLSDGKFNPLFHKELLDGNALQDYKGYETAKNLCEWYSTPIKSNQLNFSYGAPLDCIRFSPSPEFEKNSWYLPAIGELIFLAYNYDQIQERLRKIIKVCPNCICKTLKKSYYWSSTEEEDLYSWEVDLDFGYVDTCTKQDVNYVRPFCIR